MATNIQLVTLERSYGCLYRPNADYEIFLSWVEALDRAPAGVLTVDFGGNLLDAGSVYIFKENEKPYNVINSVDGSTMIQADLSSLEEGYSQAAFSVISKNKGFIKMIKNMREDRSSITTLVQPPLPGVLRPLDV